MIVHAPDFMKKICKKTAQSFHCAVSKVFDRVKSVALWSENIIKLAKDNKGYGSAATKTLSTIWYTYMTLVTKYQISAISYGDKCDEKYLGRTDRGKTVYPTPPSGSGGIKIICKRES